MLRIYVDAEFWKIGVMSDENKANILLRYEYFLIKKEKRGLFIKKVYT